MIFLVQFGINKHLLIFSKTTNCTRPTGSCNFAFWLSVWKKWCLEKGIAEEIENYALRARAILLVFKKNLLVLIYSKLHSKSCDYLYK